MDALAPTAGEAAGGSGVPVLVAVGVGVRVVSTWARLNGAGAKRAAASTGALPAVRRPPPIVVSPISAVRSDNAGQPAITSSAARPARSSAAEVARNERTDSRARLLVSVCDERERM